MLRAAKKELDLAAKVRDDGEKQLKAAEMLLRELGMSVSNNSSGHTQQPNSIAVVPTTNIGAISSSISTTDNSESCTQQSQRFVPTTITPSATGGGVSSTVTSLSTTDEASEMSVISSATMDPPADNDGSSLPMSEKEVTIPAPPLKKAVTPIDVDKVMATNMPKKPAQKRKRLESKHIEAGPSNDGSEQPHSEMVEVSEDETKPAKGKCA
jgi:hypothetical protein